MFSIWSKHVTNTGIFNQHITISSGEFGCAAASKARARSMIYTGQESSYLSLRYERSKGRQKTTDEGECLRTLRLRGFFYHLSFPPLFSYVGSRYIGKLVMLMLVTEVKSLMIPQPWKERDCTNMEMRQNLNSCDLSPKLGGIIQITKTKIIIITQINKRHVYPNPRLCLLRL